MICFYVVRVDGKVYYILILAILIEVTTQPGQLMHPHSQDEKLRCPYKGCGKPFDKPKVLTDLSTIPRQTFFACPYCMSRLDIVIEDNEKMKLASVKTSDQPKIFSSPAECVHHFGFLSALPKDASIPDECLVCPKVLQCSLKKR